VTQAVPFIIVRAANGATVDFTLRIARPQLDLGGLTALEPLRTTNAFIELPNAATPYEVIPPSAYPYYPLTYSPDPTAKFQDEVFYVDRKVHEDKLFTQFELSSVLDLAGVMLPGRQIIQNVCPWRYRGADCGYAGGPVAKLDDTATANPAEDNCGKRLASCKLRFGANAELPYGGFPAAGLVRV
jgi:hypothetical protein